MNLSFKSLSKKTKNLRYGGYSAVVSVIVVAALVLVTVLAELTDISIDLTPSQIYTPGDLTVTVLDEVEDDIAIYGLFTTGSETYNTYAPIVELAEQYARLCSKVSYKTIDTLKHPEFVKDYLTEEELSEGVEDGTFMVVNTVSGKYRMLDLYDFYGYLDSSSEDIDAFTAEEAFTSAIQYVTAGHTPVVYELTGHLETAVSSTLTSYLKTTNTEFISLNLANFTGEIEVDGYSMVLINTPMTDLYDSEYETLLDYMERGGRMIVIVGWETPGNLTNFNKLLSRFGLSIGADSGTQCIVETSASNTVSSTGYAIIPTVNTGNDAISGLTGKAYSYTMPYSVPIWIEDSASGKTKYQSLLETATTSYLYNTNTGEPVCDSEGEVLTGPFTVGVVATEDKQVGEQSVCTKLAVFGSRSFLDASLLDENFVTTGNYRLLAEIIGYMQDDIDDLYISGKSLSNASIQTTTGNFIAGLTVFGVAIPLALVVAGLVIYFRRKRL